MSLRWNQLTDEQQAFVIDTLRALAATNSSEALSTAADFLSVKKGQRRCGCQQAIDNQQARTREMGRQLRACKLKLKYVRAALPSASPFLDHFDNEWREAWNPEQTREWFRAQALELGAEDES